MDYSFAGKDKETLRKYTGNISQIAGVRRSVLDDGRGRGIRVADISNGSGLRFTVLYDKGMDIGAAEFRGIPIAYMTRAGYSNPAFYEPEGLGWLRNWCGGLLTGCGLKALGGPSSFEGEDFGLHGRISNIPAENCSSSCEWINGKYVMSVSGTVAQSMTFFEDLRLTRKISTVMGENKIRIEDSIENLAHNPSPFMLLYHINLGFPLLSEKAFIEAGKHEIEPRDGEAAGGLDSWNKCQVPTAGFKEQVFCHDLPEDSEGIASVALCNPDLDLKLKVSYRKKELPYLIHWKMMGEGEYVTGLEPSNCHTEGIVAEKEKYKTLRYINPGETVSTFVEIELSAL